MIRFVLSWLLASKKLHLRDCPMSSLWNSAESTIADEQQIARTPNTDTWQAAAAH